MKITIEPTAEIVEDSGGRGRIWIGQTDDGVPVKCCISWVSPQTHDHAANQRFADELTELFPDKDTA